MWCRIMSISSRDLFSEGMKKYNTYCAKTPSPIIKTKLDIFEYFFNPSSKESSGIVCSLQWNTNKKIRLPNQHKRNPSPVFIIPLKQTKTVRF